MYSPANKYGSVFGHTPGIAHLKPKKHSKRRQLQHFPQTEPILVYVNCKGGA
jgi:hypothetical protein